MLRANKDNNEMKSLNREEEEKWKKGFKSNSATLPLNEGKVPPSLRHEIGLADCMTLGNAVSGTLIIFLCLNYLENEHENRYMKWAFILYALGLVFDLCDGWIARRLYSSPFGSDLDSLADLVTFGVAPATLGFTLGLRGFWDCICLAIFTICGLSRLARYNVTAELLRDDRGKVKYYEGLPIPSSAFLVAILLCAWQFDSTGPNRIFFGQYFLFFGYFHPLSLLFLFMGFLMVSQIRIPKP